MYTYNKSSLGEVTFEGVEYQLIEEAYLENYRNETAMFCRAITGEKDEDGNNLIYLVRWDAIDAENLEDCADWDNPVSAELHC